MLFALAMYSSVPGVGVLLGEWELEFMVGLIEDFTDPLFLQKYYDEILRKVIFLM